MVGYNKQFDCIFPIFLTLYILKGLSGHENDCHSPSYGERKPCISDLNDDFEGLDVPLWVEKVLLHLKLNKPLDEFKK